MVRPSALRQAIFGTMVAGMMMVVKRPPPTLNDPFTLTLPHPQSSPSTSTDQPPVLRRLLTPSSTNSGGVPNGMPRYDDIMLAVLGRIQLWRRCCSCVREIRTTTLSLCILWCMPRSTPHPLHLPTRPIAAWRIRGARRRGKGKRVHHTLSFLHGMVTPDRVASEGVGGHTRGEAHAGVR